MLILVPTELEAKPLRERGLQVALVGMGPVEAAVRASVLFQKYERGPVVLVGLGGAYPGSGLQIGELALANAEHFGDLGICSFYVSGGLEDLPCEREYALHHPLLEKAAALLEEGGFPVALGSFVTVCCASRDPVRAKLLATRHGGALIENMEGFAVARVAREFSRPLIELRAVSNLLAEPERPWDFVRPLEHLAEALTWLVRKF